MFFRGVSIQRHERGRCDLLQTLAFPHNSTELSCPVVIPPAGSLRLDLRSPLSTFPCRRRERHGSSDHYPSQSPDQRFQGQVGRSSEATPCIQNQADPPVLKIRLDERQKQNHHPRAKTRHSTGDHELPSCRQGAYTKDSRDSRGSVTYVWCLLGNRVRSPGHGGDPLPLRGDPLLQAERIIRAVERQRRQIASEGRATFTRVQAGSVDCIGPDGPCRHVEVSRLPHRPDLPG